ncbi:hypothetical protein BC831DRAFT_470130 [Entophlyctis helioformis]|nr:hypothetical protein BC831DRAFT_470130 [Entophlyctis helioformis]
MELLSLVLILPMLPLYLLSMLCSAGIFAVGIPFVVVRAVFIVLRGFTKALFNRNVWPFLSRWRARLKFWAVTGNPWAEPPAQMVLDEQRLLYGHGHFGQPQEHAIFPPQPVVVPGTALRQHHQQERLELRQQLDQQDSHAVGATHAVPSLNVLADSLDLLSTSDVASVSGSMASTGLSFTARPADARQQSATPYTIAEASSHRGLMFGSLARSASQADSETSSNGNGIAADTTGTSSTSHDLGIPEVIQPPSNGYVDAATARNQAMPASRLLPAFTISPVSSSLASRSRNGSATPGEPATTAAATAAPGSRSMTSNAASANRLAGMMHALEFHRSGSHSRMSSESPSATSDLMSNASGLSGSAGIASPSANDEDDDSSAGRGQHTRSGADAGLGADTTDAAKLLSLLSASDAEQHRGRSRWAASINTADTPTSPSPSSSSVASHSLSGSPRRRFHGRISPIADPAGSGYSGSVLGTLLMAASLTEERDAASMGARSSLARSSIAE